MTMHGSHGFHANSNSVYNRSLMIIIGSLMIIIGSLIIIIGLLMYDLVL